MSSVPPKGWRRDRLKDVAAINRRSLSVSTNPDLEIEYLEISNVDSCGIIDRDAIEKVAFGQAPSRARRQVAKGATIISSVRPNLQAVAYIDGSDSHLVCSTGFNVVEPDEGVLFPRYLYYSLASTDARDYFMATSTGVGYPAIGDKFFGSFEITFPPLSEQRRIAVYLDDKCAAIGKAVAAKRKQLEALDKAWSSVLYETVTRGSINEKGVPQSSLPTEWRVRKLGEIGRCQNGISKDGQYFGYGAPFVSYKDVYDDSKLPDTPMGLVDSSEEEQERYSVRRGDIFFTRTSETADEVGFSSVCLKTIPKATFAGFVIRVRPAIEILLPEYSRYYFRSSSVCQFFAKEMMVVTRASLSQHILKSIPVLIPPLTEQRRIVTYLDERRTAIDSLKANLRRQIDVLEQYRKSLIHECVTGGRRLG